jgi:hypothetical protein
MKIDDDILSTGVTYEWIKERFGWTRPVAKEKMLLMGARYQRNTKRWKRGKHG